MREDFSLKTKNGNLIRVSVYNKNKDFSSPCLFLVHGFKGFKDWGFWPYTANYLANNGFFVIAFNFSHNGVGKSLVEFDELDKFAKNTISLEVSELVDLINAYRKGFFTKSISEEIGLVGHSRGGAVSLLTAAKNENIKAVCVWASVAKLDRYTERQKKEWREKGFVEVLNTRTNQMMRLNVELLNDIEENIGGSLSIEKSVKDLNIPLKIVHGEQDITVPDEEAKLIYNWSDKSNSDLLTIPAAGHTFNIVHPFTESNEKFEIVLKETKNFFNKNLKQNF